MFRNVLPVIIVGALIVGGWVFRQQIWSESSSSPPENAEDLQPLDQGCRRAVHALGYLLPRQGIMSVSGTPGDQLAVLNAKEGVEVLQGELLAELASKDLRYLEWKARESQRMEAEKLLAAQKVASEKQIAAARLAEEKIALQKIEEAAQEAQIQFLETNLRFANRSLERLRGVSDNLVSAQKREELELLVEKTRAELEAAKLALQRMKATREYGEKAAKAELAVAEAGLVQVDAADQTRSLGLAEQIAKLQYEQTLIEAPIAGTILKTFVQPGESLGGQPILQMADLDYMICQAEVFETDIQCVYVGQSVRVTSPAFPSPHDEQGILGNVRQISRLVAAPKLQSLDPYAAADRHVVEVEIAFEIEASRIAGKFVNLQVQVEFLTDADN